MILSYSTLSNDQNLAPLFAISASLRAKQWVVMLIAAGYLETRRSPLPSSSNSA